MHTDVPARVEGLVAIARRLCALGANPNAEYHWNWHPELPRTALWGAVCAIRHLPLAEVLLEAGANPTDGVTAHIAGGGGNLDALELLHRYGVNVNGIPGGVPPLVYMMQWADNPAGPHWLLDHGADANLAWGDDGEAPLHVAARRWDVPMVERLVQHGADVSRRRADGATPHTLAELHGNPDIAAWLLAHGATDELSPRRSLRRRLRARRSRSRRGHAGGPARLADRAASRAPPDAPSPGRERQRRGARDDARVRVRYLTRGTRTTSRRCIARRWAATPDAVRVLLKYGADVNALDGMFSAIAARLGRRRTKQREAPGSRLTSASRGCLIAAGSPLEWTPPEGAPGPERTLEGLTELKQLAAAVRTT